MWEQYLENLKKRSAKSRAKYKHQLFGLQIAEILQDRPHKSLYMKFAKAGRPEVLLDLAREVASRTKVGNRGGYFMRIVTQIPRYRDILAKHKSKRLIIEKKS